MLQKSCSLNCSMETKNEILTRSYGTFEQFIELFKPSAQMCVCHDPVNCVAGNYPRLRDLKAYNENADVAFIIPHIYNLSSYCGARDKIDKEQYVELATLIASRYGYLKVTEVMLLFHRLKQGDYGRFYGSIDPQIITIAISKFITERNILIAKHEEKLREQREREDRKKSITYEEWKKMQAQSQ